MQIIAQKGAQAYALLSQATARVLRRSIRYAVERKRAIEALNSRDAQMRGVLDALRESVAVLNRAGSVVSADHVPAAVTGAALIGVDLGPNLSVTGSLATILWLVALRREGQHVGLWQFLAVGAIVTPPALLLTLGVLLALGS